MNLTQFIPNVLFIFTYMLILALPMPKPTFGKTKNAK